MERSDRLGHRRAVTGAALLLCLAGCGTSEEDRVQNVAFCQGSTSENPAGDPVQVEFRQGSTVLARASVSSGVAVTVQVPVGGVGIYVDGVLTGSANEGVDTDGPYSSPAPDEFVYLAGGEGCPDTPPPLPAQVTSSG